MVWYERKRQSSSCPVKRDRSEEEKTISYRLGWVASSPPGAMVISRPGLLPRPMSVSVVLLRSQSVLMFMAPITTKGQEKRALAQSWPCPLTGCNH